MRIARPLLLPLLATTLAILLPALALLQYRWVGQVSDAERERMQTHLRNAAQQFHEALDGEFARAIANLQIGAGTAREGGSDRYADRYEGWANASAHPGIVGSVYLVDADAGDLRVRRWNQATRTLDAAPWPTPLVGIRSALGEDYRLFRTAGGFGRPQLPPLPESLTLLPLRPEPPGQGPGTARTPAPPAWGFTAIVFDEAYLREQVLPELAQRYFALDADLDYRVAVLSSSDQTRVVFLSDPEAPTSAATADIVEPLLTARAFIVRGGGRGGRGGDRRRAFLGQAPARGPAPDQEPTTNPEPPPDPGRWTLLARHQLGSLEAAVAATRRRNLGISFGSLLLLSGTVLMLALSSRRAERLAKQQMEFVAGVSHELRTPIAVIRAAAENLSQGVVASPDRVRRYGETMGIEARRLGDMVERVLQYAGIEAGRVISSTSPIAVADVVDEALHTAQPMLQSVGVTVERDVEQGLPLVMGDHAALTSAVQNLVTNAAKYGGPEKWLAVRVTLDRGARGEEVRIAVEDRGPGIAHADLPHLFEPFYRGADATSAQIQGNGLGLAIVKRVIEAHGGRVTVATKAGNGTTFTLHLPAAQAHDAPQASAAFVDTHGAPARS